MTILDKGQIVASYTVRIRKGGRDGAPWQQVIADHIVTDARPPQELCDDIAHRNTTGDGWVWHVQVWAAEPSWALRPKAEIYKRLLP